MLAACLFVALVHAAYPDRPLRLIVPFPAGGAADVMARGMAQQLSARLGQPVIIDNRGGAGGAPAAEAVAKSAPDGYTLFFATMGTQAINPALYSRLHYDPVKDFEPVALTHITPRVLVLVVGPSLKVDSVAALVALAKTKPGGLTYGSSSHLSGAVFEALTGITMVHVPYQGSSPLLVDVLGRFTAGFARGLLGRAGQRSLPR